MARLRTLICILLIFLLMVIVGTSFAEEDTSPYIAGSTVSAPAGNTDYTAHANMQAYWMMEQATAADAPDGSGNGNTLTRFSDDSGPTQAADPMQGTYSADFNAANYEGYLRTDANLSASFPGKSTGDVNGSFSLGGWVKVDTDGAKEIAVKFDGSTGSSYRLQYDGTNFSFGVSETGESLTVVTDDTAITEDGTVWYHVVGVYDATNDEIEIFVNGTLNVSAVAFAVDMNTGGVDFRLGKKNTAFDGHMDEMFIMNTDLSSTQVLEIYQHGLAGDR